MRQNPEKGENPITIQYDWILCDYMYNSNETSIIKKMIKNNMIKAIEKYESAADCKGMFEEPLISYHYAKDPLFDTLYRKGLCEHPQKIYRPGNTLITYFIPYASHITESNKGGSVPSQEWIAVRNESTKLIMTLNRAIRKVLEDHGRLVSCLNTPIDWNDKKAHESWSFKIAAYLSGMGSFSTAGSFITEKGFAGRFSGVITDGLLFDSKPLDLSTAEAEKITEKIFNDSYRRHYSNECIASCPCGAISKNNIDRFKCQEHCKKINNYTPSPDVCGKCFFFANQI